MTVYVSMLRAVNVGGRGLIKMEPLREAYESAGLADVRTLLQSGNVLFRSGLTDRQRLVKRIMQEIGGASIADRGDSADSRRGR
jgi:uncharacterized protein (DUF1697 family)